MKKAITLNDIACALHLSRNTVSKALQRQIRARKDAQARTGYRRAYGL